MDENPVMSDLRGLRISAALSSSEPSTCHGRHCQVTGNLCQREHYISAPPLVPWRPRLNTINHVNFGHVLCFFNYLTSCVDDMNFYCGEDCKMFGNN